MFFRQAEQKHTRFCREMMPPVWLIDAMPDVSTDIGLLIMTNPQSGPFFTAVPFTFSRKTLLLRFLWYYQYFLR